MFLRTMWVPLHISQFKCVSEEGGGSYAGGFHVLIDSNSNSKQFGVGS
jgi:hypothetical protein